MKIKNHIHKEEYKIEFDKDLKGYLSNLNQQYYKISVITDENIYKIYKNILNKKYLNTIKIKPGEKSKSIENKIMIEEKLLKLKFNRKSVIVALGGGVVGDLVGFVASTFLRGIDLIQIPTSLVAMVDSSIGGKTGINNDSGKNLIGTFYNPKKIIVNSSFLKTLPESELRQGLAEIIKYGVIYDLRLFKLLEKININFMENSQQIINKIIKNCIAIKVKVVEEDFKETDKRSILNFGHTVGHGLEKLYSYKKSHGDCIGLGMAIEASIANKYFDLNDESLNKIYKILDRFALRSIRYSSTQIKSIIKYMELDKKNKTNKITFSLPNKIGSIMLNNKKHTIEVSKEKINAVLKEFL